MKWSNVYYFRDMVPTPGQIEVGAKPQIATSATPILELVLVYIYLIICLPVIGSFF